MPLTGGGFESILRPRFNKLELDVLNARIREADAARKTRQPAPEVYLGCDFGQSIDYSTAVAVRKDPDGVFTVLGLQRWPKMTEYAQVINDIVIKCSWPELSGCWLVVDRSGVGRPIVEELKKARPDAKIRPVTMTAATTGLYHVRDEDVTVSRLEILSTLQVVFQNGRVRLPREHALTGVLIKELQELRVRVTAANNETIEARKHDDLAVALGLPVWLAEKGRKVLWLGV